MRFGNEARVGFVVLLALALAMTGYLFLRGVGLGADLYTIRLNSAAAIAKGNDVLLQGIKVGVVRNVGLDAATQKPLLTIAIEHADPPFKLLKSYRYAVQPSGIIGENYVDIRGSYNESTPLYAANSDEAIPGLASPGIAALTDSASQISAKLAQTLDKVNVTIERVNKGVLSYENQVRLARTLDSVAKLTNSASRTFGPGTQNELASALRNANRAAAEGALAARNIRVITEQAGGSARGLSRQADRLANQTSGVLSQANSMLVSGNGIIGENREELRQLLRSFRATANNTSSLTRSLTFLVRDSKLTENSQVILNSLRRSAENVEATTGGLRRFADDPALTEGLRSTLAALRSSSESLAVTTQTVQKLITDETSQNDLKSILSTFKETSATLQATTQNFLSVSEGLKNTIADPQLQRDIKAIPTELLGTLQAARGAAERIEGLLGGRRRREQTTGEDGRAGSTKAAEPANIASLDSGLSFTVRRLGERDARGNRTFGDIDFRGELFGGPLRAGLANIGEDTDITLQTGQFIGRNAAVRYGVFRSKLGVGLDYQKGRLRLEGNLYDPNRRSYALYGGIRLTPQVEVLVGTEKSPGVRSGSVGVRLSR